MTGPALSGEPLDLETLERYRRLTAPHDGVASGMELIARRLLAEIDRLRSPHTLALVALGEAYEKWERLSSAHISVYDIRADIDAQAALSAALTTLRETKE